MSSAVNNNYYISDFTEANYLNLLEIAKNKVGIKTYSEALNCCGVVMRHDIDYSIHRAYALSKIEHKANVPSYYFVLLHSEFYNVLEKNEIELLREMVKRGRNIGLHFDPSFYDIRIDEAEKLEHYVTFEKNMLETLLDVEVNYMSFHNPDVGGDWYKLPNEVIGGLKNVYGEAISKNFEYCSDSNGYWRYRRLQDVLEDSTGKRIQVLTHPGWWTETEMWPYDRIKRCVDGRAEKTITNYISQLKRDNRINVMGSVN